MPACPCLPGWGDDSMADRTDHYPPQNDLICGRPRRSPIESYFRAGQVYTRVNAAVTRAAAGGDGRAVGPAVRRGPLSRPLPPGTHVVMRGLHGNLGMRPGIVTSSARYQLLLYHF